MEEGGGGRRGKDDSGGEGEGGGRGEVEEVEVVVKEVGERWRKEGEMVEIWRQEMMEMVEGENCNGGEEIYVDGEIVEIKVVARRGDCHTGEGEGGGEEGRGDIEEERVLEENVDVLERRMWKKRSGRRIQEVWKKDKEKIAEEGNRVRNRSLGGGGAGGAGGEGGKGERGGRPACGGREQCEGLGRGICPPFSPFWFV